MRRTARGPRVPVRALIVIGIGLLGILNSARSANAMGCHAAERPTLGLSSLWDSPSVPVFTEDIARPARLGRLPCSREVPGSIQTLSPAGAVAPGTAPPPSPFALSAERRRPPAEVVRPRILKPERERPPRPTSA